MKKIILAVCAALTTITITAQNPKVYFTNDISPESLVKTYEALGVAPKEGQRVAVKISTGESEKSNHLRPEFIKNLVQKVNGNIVECNTAYGGNRSTTAKHKQAIAERGYTAIALLTFDFIDVMIIFRKANRPGLVTIVRDGRAGVDADGCLKHYFSRILR